MKQNYTFHTSVIVSTALKNKPEALDLSIEAFNDKEYRKSLHFLLDSLNQDVKKQCGNPRGNEFNIPHGPINIQLKMDEEKLSVTAPFIYLPEKQSIAIMRQLAVINFNDLDLARLVLKNNRLDFKYHCPLAFSHPHKIRHVLEEICHTAVRHDYKFCKQFNAERIHTPRFTPYTPEMVDYAYKVLQESCRECLEALRYFESARQFNDMWTILMTTFLKIMYVIHPQGKMQDTLVQAIRDMNRDIPQAIVVTDAKQTIKELQKKKKEEILPSLYHVETFISDKKQCGWQDLRENLKNCYKQVSASMEAGNYRHVCLKTTYKFYETYYHYHLQEDLDGLLQEALSKASAQSWEKAASLLYQALETIMEGRSQMKSNPTATAA